MPMPTAELADRARAAGRLGIDTEFMGEGRYQPLLCLIQIALDDGNGGAGIVVLHPPTAEVDTHPPADPMAHPPTEGVPPPPPPDAPPPRRDRGAPATPG